MATDLLHPLVTDGAGRDNEGGAGGHGRHGHQAVRAVERRGVAALLLVVDTVGVLPQQAVKALDTRLDGKQRAEMPSHSYGHKQKQIHLHRHSTQSPFFELY